MGDPHRRRPVSWSKLSPTLILTISKHLITKSDIVSFRQVCKKWRKYSFPPLNNIFSSVLPLPIPSCDTNPRLPFHNSLVLQVRAIYLITSVNLKPWMVMAEETSPGKVHLRHPLTGKRVKHYPPTLDLTRFKATELTEGYNLKHSELIHKVFLCSSSSSSSLEAMVLYGEGILGKLKLEKNENDSDDDDEEEKEEYCYQWQSLKMRKGGFRCLDDMVSFKGMAYGVDRMGKLHLLDHEAMTVGPVLVADQLNRADNRSARRKRLVVDPMLGRLYLVVREHVQVKARFKVYRYNEHLHRWRHMVNGIGSHRVLFVGVDHCFFAKARDFLGCDGIIGNCIMFAANCFTQYCGRNFPDRCLFRNENEDVGVYRLGEEDNFSSVLACPEFSQMIWPPPTWFSPKRECEEEESDYSTEQTSQVSCSSNTSLPDEHKEGLLTDSSGESTSEEEEEEEEDKEEEEDDDEVEEMQSDSPSQQASKEISSNETSFVDEEDEVEAQISSSNDQTHASEANSADEIGDAISVGHEEQSTRISPEMNDKVLEEDIPEEKVFMNSTPVAPSLFQSCQNCASTVKFQGVEIKSHLFPTLETIWAKHGNLVGEDTVRSKDMLACALESLAKMIITLQNSTGRTMTDSQADKLRSTLFDLQRMGLKVDWLVPIVDKALALQKSKPFIESLVALDKAKAEADEREMKFLAESAKVKQEIEENRAYLSTRIPLTEPIDLDECLGEGLC